ncbi:GNAT family N-acetyltransferase [Streptomyces sp. NBC_01261]|uniref:GNAT family N-acetyltransferase n=1 Tax=Streptomyces sp. NBC_01261 TaxID=2903802 RepID=UPI002E351DC9|nr:GNAT family N-acetyltransferase [Streptomyces sp. NBC_01261]
MCRAADVALLDQCIGSPGVVSTRACRFARQETGGGTCLVAWLDGRPVGHAEVIWDGCAAPEVRAALPGCPELNGLAVWPPQLRSRGIGGALIRRAEELAREHGRTALGLGVVADNPRAADLCARLGYRPLTDYVDRWSYEDRDGVIRECVDPCTFLTKELPSGPLDVKRP